jgi:metal-responsive CopG/Arc/MetJ family transcriptional regulator
MRVQVNLSEEMLDRCDYYSKKMGVTRSSLCSMLIGQGIMSYDKSMDILQLIGDKVGDSLLADKAIQEVGDDDKQ